MADEITLSAARALLPARPADGHKGIFGHVFIIAGSRGFMGAGKLAWRAAARSGAGLVTWGIPFPLGDVAAVDLVEGMALRLAASEAETVSQDALDRCLNFAGDKDAVVLGPGISRHGDTAAFVHDFVPQCPAPLVLDADGLNNLSEDVSVLHNRENATVLTPHPGEMARLTQHATADIQADRPKAASDFARAYGVVVVLKGKGTVVAAPDGRLSVNTSGNEGLASGGTGDVLAGLLGGLLAQGMDAFDAARLGVFVHGLAGDCAAAAKSARGLIAGDVVEAIPAAWRMIEAE